MENISLALFAGADIPVPDCKLIIHQPTIQEIGMIGEMEYFTGGQLLGVTKKTIDIEDESLLENTSNFQIFMTTILDKRMADKKENLMQALSLLCPNYKIVFTPSSMLMTKEGQSVIIDENNFELLQEVIFQVLCIGNQDGIQGSFNPKGKKAKLIAEKLMKARAKVAEQNGTGKQSILAQQASCLAIGLKLPLDKVLNMTLYQLLDQMERYQLYLAWDIDIRSRMAGAKNDKEIENWMKPIH